MSHYVHTCGTNCHEQFEAEILRIENERDRLRENLSVGSRHWLEINADLLAALEEIASDDLDTLHRRIARAAIARAKGT